MLQNGGSIIRKLIPFPVSNNNKLMLHNNTSVFNIGVNIGTIHVIVAYILVI
jgi:hypothetical protein